MRFEVLGPLQVIPGESDEPQVLTAAKPRALLAALLWRANQAVPADELAELVWDGAPPVGAADATRALVMRLRRKLGMPGAARIVTRSAGYAIEISDDELDASRFEALIQDAGTAVRAERWTQAARTASEAVGLWRGTPLADIPSLALRDKWVPHLEELHLQALEWRAEANLREGQHEQLVAELRELIASHPLRERFHGQLMLALCQCGRQAEALAAYQRVRDVLISELGVEPGTALQDLHQRILRGEPVLAGGDRPDGSGPWPGAPRESPGQTAPGRDVPAVPHELPPAAPGFTGRSEQLQALTRLLDRPGERDPGTVVISAIGGTAGVGKTALAVHWAHKAAHRFPDGQLYVNLRGYDPGQPVPPADALSGFLRALGVPGQEIPPDEAQRSARYRTLLAGKRMLIILDNAGSAGQVRPLLPGSSTCAVIVTSRDTLAGLVARDGAARLDLDVLSQPEAISLLRALIGDRVDTEPDAAARLAAACCRLPLALRVAAELAASRPTIPLARLADDLAGLRGRLDLLDAGDDPGTQVRAVFSWSYRHLDDDAARAFRRLGLHPGTGIEPYATAALADVTVRQARRILDTLARARLLSPSAPGRYGTHDLLRSYASELAGAEDTEPERDAARTRLFDYYLYTAATAADALFPAGRGRPAIPRPSTPVPELAGPDEAREWLDTERATLVAVAGYAAARDWAGHSMRLAVILSGYLGTAGHFPEALSIFGHALDAARRVGDRTAEARALTLIGNIDYLQSRFERASDHHRQALAMFRESGDKPGEARALSSIGLSETGLGRYEDAARHEYEALAVYRELGDRVGVARALSNLGLTRQRQGRYEEAADCHQQILDLSRATGDREGEAWALTGLGTVDLRLGHHQKADRRLRQALAIFRDLGHATGECEVLPRVGEVCLRLGDDQQAAGTLRHAVTLARELGDRTVEADALNCLGELLSQTGDTENARKRHADALTLASRAGSPQEQGRAHRGLARACEAAGDFPQGQYHWRKALACCACDDAPEAAERP